MVAEVKKRNLLSRVFFQDPVGNKPKKNKKIEGEPTANPTQPRSVNSGLTAILSIEVNGNIFSKNFSTFPFFIGREATESGLLIDDSSVSRQHAVMDYRNGSLIITDANSSNGVEVNGVRITPNAAYVLHAGDTIKIGRAAITVVNYYSSADNLFMDKTEFIPAEEHDAVQINAGESKSMMFCTQCGNKNEKQTAFCIKCGFKLV